MFDFLKVSISNIISENFQQQVESKTIQINATPIDFVGDCTIVVFPFTKFSKLNPEATGNYFGEKLKLQNPDIESFNVVKGFLNIVFTQQFWLNQLAQASTQTNYGVQQNTGKK
jgi:arginyl-tRNA synthetase